jgi:uncharacterized membrane protein YqaE (UPF0057 family)
MGKLLLIVLAIFLPPLAVFLRRGLGVTFFLNLLLSILFLLPGTIHALYVLLADQPRT